MARDMKTSTRRSGLLFICIGAFIIRLIYVGFVVNALPCDEASYHNQAVRITEQGFGAFGPNYSSKRAPLYSLVIAAVYALFGVSSLYVCILQALLSALLPFFVFGIAEKLFSRSVAYCAALITAVYPIIIFYTGVILTETLFVFLVVAATWFLIRDQKALGALTLGLSALARPVSVPLVIIFSLWKKSWFILLLFCIVIAPWLVRNFVVLDKVVPLTTEGPYHFFACNNPLAEGTGVWETKERNLQFKDQYGHVKNYYREGFSFIINNPKAYAVLIGQKFIRFWNIFPGTPHLRDKLLSALSYGVILPFFIVGFFRTRTVLHWIILYFFLFHITYSYGSLRFRLAIEPFIIIIASTQIMALFSKVFPRTTRHE